MAIELSPYQEIMLLYSNLASEYGWDFASIDNMMIIDILDLIIVKSIERYNRESNGKPRKFIEDLI